MIGSVNHIIIVAGCQRSGTTLTGQILGAHEHAMLVDEFDGLYPWFHAVADGAETAPKLSAEIARKCLPKYANPETRFSQQGKEVALKENVKAIILKAPNLTYDFDKIAGLKHKVHVLYPVRDPRAVVASMQRLSHISFVDNQMRLLGKHPKVTQMFADDFAMIEDMTTPHHIRAAHLWKIKSGLASALVKRDVPVLQFKYEDAVADPKSWVGKMLEFCQLPESQTVYAHETVYVGEGPGGTDRKRPIDKKAVESWRSELSAQDAEEVIAAAQPLAGELGYV